MSWRTNSITQGTIEEHIHAMLEEVMPACPGKSIASGGEGPITELATTTDPLDLVSLGLS